jgi:hypothetical protein
MNNNMKKLVKSAESVPDVRRTWGHLLHKLSDILVIAFCAIICDAQTYRDIERSAMRRSCGFPIT